MASFVDTLEGQEKTRADALRRIILAADKAVREVAAPIMRATDALTYEEDGVFKYGLAAAKAHVSFHSMVMYAHKDIADLTKELFPASKVQKGCVNFPDFAAMEPETFKRLLQESAQADFSGVIAHYKKKR